MLPLLLFDPVGCPKMWPGLHLGAVPFLLPWRGALLLHPWLEVGEGVES